MIIKSHTIWNEKYRPQTLDTYVGNETIKTTFKQYIENNDVPHLLLYGDAGSGKTTLAKIVANSIAKDNYIYINKTFTQYICKITNYNSKARIRP